MIPSSVFWGVNFYTWGGRAGGRQEKGKREKRDLGREKQRNEGDRKGEIYCMHCSTLVPYEFYVRVHVPLLLHTYMHMCVYTCTCM